jgi:diguanylate cyclase (GGDEF)-like protein/PAS domain S-box-containing protein
MAPKNETVRLLVLHESQDNAEQIVNALKNSGTATRPHLVNDEESLIESLKTGSWDIFLAGEMTGSLGFDRVLGLVRKEDKDIPTIVLLNATDPELVLDALQQGAVDAVPYDAHLHMVQVIKRELANLYHRRAHRRAEVALRESEKRCELLLDNSRDAIAYVHDGMHIYTNKAYIELFCYESNEDLEGTPVIDLVAKEDLNSFKEYLRAYSKGERISGDLHFHGLTADGSKVDAMMQLSSASYDGEPCTQVVIRRDDGNAAVLAEKLREVVNQDALTGLPNRQGFEDNLAQAINKAHKDKSRFALYYMAIDNFSQISGSAGIAGSDLVIRELAKMLAEALPGAALARFGDSSFAALVPDIDIEKAGKLADAAAKGVHDHLIGIPGGKTVQTSLSIGVTMIGETASDPADMFSRALSSAEKVKVGGGNGVSVYNPAENASGSDSAMLELLVDALENSKFKLLFQPLTDVNGEGGSFFEVFLRLPLSDGKMMTPDDFMVVAQKHQLGAKLDRWVLLNAAKLLKEHAKVDPRARMLVNLTAESLADMTLPAWISKLSKAVNPKQQALIVQFAESDVVTYLKQAKDLSAALTQAGCPVSLSHYGCTLNPLNTLKHITVEYIKLDRSFTQDLSNEENLGAMKKAATDLNGENKKIIVSFVENAQTLSKLWTLGVHYLQGYYLAPPSESLAEPEQ